MATSMLLSVMLRSGTHSTGKTQAAKAMVEALHGKRPILTLAIPATTSVPPVEGYQVFEQDLAARQRLGMDSTGQQRATVGDIHQDHPIVLERSAAAPVRLAPADQQDFITRAILNHKP